VTKYSGSHPFLDGIVLAAQHVRIPQADVLARDRPAVFKYSLRTGVLKTPSNRKLATRAQIQVADNWLCYRAKRLEGSLKPNVLAASQRSPQVAQLVGKRAARATGAIPDPDFLQMYAGAQMSLHRLDPKLDREMLLLDWDGLPDVYSHFAGIYRKNGVSAAGASLLLNKELLEYRVLNPGSALGGILTGSEPRFGLLDLATDPTEAQVNVDKEDWGKSPTTRAVRAGRHNVQAEKKPLKADKKVDVVAAKENHFDLKLT